MSKTYSAGIVTAYGAAKRAGYTGTYEDFCRQQAGYAESAATVEQAKNTAVSAANTATTKAGEAATAATAAQTAKTQTEQSASQALTDIAAARSGAISAVQTVGVTQTSNATAQAQAAAQSATTASTKASEASASATSAGQSATNAAASATSAATSASAAQAVLDSIPEDYSDLSEDVDQLKADVDEINEVFDYTTDSEIITLIHGSFIKTNQTEVNLTPITSASFNTGGYAIVDCQKDDVFIINGSGAVSGRLWCFIDSNNDSISTANINTTGTNLTLVAPAGAVKLIINSTTNAISKKGYTISEKVTRLEDINDYTLRLIPKTELSYDSYTTWSGSAVTTTDAFVPLTVKQKIMLIGLKFKTVFTEVCTLTIFIRDKNKTVVYNTAKENVTTTGEVEIDISIPTILEAGEYSIVFAVSSGCIYYPVVSTRELLSDDFIENSGTSYYYNNSSIIFSGIITYTTETQHLEIPIDDVVFANPNVITGEVYVTSGWSVSDGVFTCAYTGNSRKWFKYTVDKSILVDNILAIDADVTLEEGSSFYVYVFGTKIDNSAFYGHVHTITEDGHVAVEVDLNSLSIYGDLDMDKTIECGIANGTTNSCYGTVSNFKLTTPKYRLDASKAFYENVNDMSAEIDANANAISVLTSGQYLVSPDGSKYILKVGNDGTLFATPTIPDKSLFIGNSLLLGNGYKYGYGENCFGMCASASNKDYFYYVKTQIQTQKPNATFARLMARNFEQCLSTEAATSWMTTNLLPLLSDDLDLVVIQLGDNVATSEMKDVFESTAPMLIQYIKTNAPAARVAWAGSYYTSERTQSIISSACAETGITFIDFTSVPRVGSYLGAIIDYGVSDTRTYNMDSYSDDSENNIVTVTFTVNGNEYTAEVPYTSFSASESTISITGNYGFVDVSAVASHPGDDTMEYIGNLIINGLGLN